VPDIRPFKGLLYDPEVAGPLEALTAGPYDSISPPHRDRLYLASPFNVVRLILGKEEPGDDASSNQYTRAAGYLRAWREQGILAATSSPAMYPYEMRFHLGGVWRSVRGLITEVQLEPWGGSILPHEATLPGPIDDRLRLLRAVRVNLSPVYGVFATASGALSAFLGQAMAVPPNREVTDESGTRHRLWVAAEGFSGVVEEMRERQLMIADGHHRYTVALAYREQMRAREGQGPWDSMMMLVVDGATEDPPVLPIHRVVTGWSSIRGRVPPTAPEGERVRDLPEVLATLRDENLTIGMVRLEEGEVVQSVVALRGDPPTVCALHAQILDHRPELELRFVPDAVEAEQAVLSGSASVAYLLPPTKVDRVWTLVEAGEKLPQKSTYFWPKPRTGLVIRPMESGTS
jgi:uncharacterized protein (DUF1015 family)